MVRKTTKKRQDNNKEPIQYGPYAVSFIVMFILIILFSFSESTALLRLVNYEVKDLFTDLANILKNIIDLFSTT